MRDSIATKLKLYVSLTKPGIIRGNILTAAAGFFLASAGDIDYKLLFLVIVGLCLVIASACVFNNYLDRNLDKKMTRTNKRALATGALPASYALIYGAGLGLAGFLILIFGVNLKSTLVALVGFIIYVGVYSPLKRTSPKSTLVGAVSGSTPPVVGYTAVSNDINSAALSLFLILFFWQMAHFYAIGLYRYKDYKKARLPIVPVKKGIEYTKGRILFYILGFIGACLLLFGLGWGGYVYMLAMLGIGIEWLRRGLKGYTSASYSLWGKKMFRFSLIVILIFCLAISLEAYLP